MEDAGKVLFATDHLHCGERAGQVASGAGRASLVVQGVAMTADPQRVKPPMGVIVT